MEEVLLQNKLILHMKLTYWVAPAVTRRRGIFWYDIWGLRI